MLSLEVIPTDAQHCTLRLSSWNHDESRLLSAVELTDVSSKLLQGNIALVANGGKRGAEVSFKVWVIGGERLTNHPNVASAQSPEPSMPTARANLKWACN